MYAMNIHVLFIIYRACVGDGSQGRWRPSLCRCQADGEIYTNVAEELQVPRVIQNCVMCNEAIETQTGNKKYRQCGEA